MRFKRALGLFLSVIFVVLFSGCESFDVQNLLSAPKLEGDMFPVQKALEEVAGEDITLKYPLSGENRSSFTLKDLNNDGTSEAVAIYSVTTDGTVTMHINVIASNKEEWTSKGDISVVANDVESISFADLDGDGNLEIIVGWMIYGLVDKQIGVYTFSGDTLIQRAMEKFTNFTTADLNEDNIDDLVIIYLNATEKTATARVFAFHESGISELGSAGLDGGVSSYMTPMLSKLKDGTPALYIDAVKGSGTITEILWLDEGFLKSLYNPEKMETAATYRQSSVSSLDFNGDGAIDVPLLEILGSTASLNDADKVYYTNWTSFTKTGSEVISSGFMNYTDGYSFAVPKEFKDRLYLTRKTESRLRVFYAFDPEDKTYGSELFRIKAVTAADYDEADYKELGFVKIGQNEGIVYIVKVEEENQLGITVNTVKELFSIIK